MPRHQPNVLFIVLDTLRRDRLSVYGAPRETSPALDAFAAKTARFTRAVAPAQWTIPAHASMFTGLYASTHEVTQGSSHLSHSYPTLAEILQVGGYHTVGFCNNPLVGVLNNGLQRGFDHFYNYAGTVPNRPVDTATTAFGREFQRRFRKFARPIENNFAQSDMLFRLSMHPWVVPVWSRGINFKGHTGNTIDDLIGYLSAHRAGGQAQPLFSFVNLMGAHLPYKPPQAILDRLAPHQSKHAYNFIRQFNTDAGQWASPPEKPFEDWQHVALTDFYDAEIAAQDEQLGRLFHYMETSGALDDTMVIVCADHGEAHGDHDFFGHGFVVYQELVHVPLLIHWPERFTAGQVIDTNVSTRRLFHTILDAAGLRPPIDETDPNIDTERLTLARAANGAPDSEGDTAFTEAFPPVTFLGVIQQRQPGRIEQLRLRQVRRGVYHGPHKLAVVHDQVEGLYNIAEDPAETQNTAVNLPDVTATLQSKLAEFVAEAESRRADSAQHVPISDAVAENLRALGYFE